MSATASAPQGAEMCIQLLALDRVLGDFFQALDRERIDYAVVLTADHGGLDLPERAREQARRRRGARRSGARRDADRARRSAAGSG